MAGVEFVVLFTSVYVAGIIVLGSIEECDRLLDVLQNFTERRLETPSAISVDGVGRVLIANPNPLPSI